MFSWIFLILFSIFIGVFVTLVVQFYFLNKYLSNGKLTPPKLNVTTEPFPLPEVLLQTLRFPSGTSTSGEDVCVTLNVLFQFLFHELRDTAKVRKWFRNKLTVEFEELLTRTAIGKIFGSIKVRDIHLGSEFPILSGITLDNVQINEEFSHVDSLDLKLDLKYKGGFRLIVDANMLLGKTAYLSIKVGELEGRARLQFTRLPYSHWSFSFYEDPRLELEVESQFQGRPLHQIPQLISNQIRKTIRKKHTLPNFKLRYKPFFTSAEESSTAEDVESCVLVINLHQFSRLHIKTAGPVYCLVGVDALPWLEIVNYGTKSYYVLDIIITKTHAQPLGITCKQEFVADQNKSGVVIDQSPHAELIKGDVLISVDGKKVVQASNVPKLLKSSAVQITLRVERRAPDRTPDRPPLSDADSSESSSISGSPAKNSDGVEKVRFLKRSMKQVINDEPTSRLFATKTVKNSQIVIFDESMRFSVLSTDRYLNMVVRGFDADQLEITLGYVNISLSSLIGASDSLHAYRIKPPDSFMVGFERQKLNGHNGFIPVLTYGDLLISAEVVSNDGQSTPFKKSLLNAGSSSTDNTSESSSRTLVAEKKHDFARTHLQSSSYCQFCGRKIWLKEAEKCRVCGMTCHKKCITKCRASTICPGQDSAIGSVGTTTSVSSTLELAVDNTNSTGLQESQRRPSVNPEIVMTTCETPQKSGSIQKNEKSGARKGLSGLLASVASAGRGLKRVGSAHNLQLPEDGASADGMSKSLPPSPQQTPSPSRKPSLPLELSEDITALLQTLLQQGTDQGDMMCFAKATGKTLYEELDLPQRKEKIQEMMNKLKAAFANEAEVRLSLEKEMSSKDPTSHTKAAFLLGKSDEKTQALTVLMLHFCAALQHIQDLEEQERDSMNESLEDRSLD